MISKKYFIASWVMLCLLIASPAPAKNSALEEALTLDRQGFIEESVDAWRKVLASPSEKNLHVYAQIKLCIALAKGAHFTEAVQSAKDLAEAYPENFNAQFNLGNMLSAIHQFPQAVQAFESAVRLKPEEGLGYVGLALTQFGNENAGEAVTLLRQVRKLFKKQKNISWYQQVRIMIGQIKSFAPYPPDFANLWLSNNLKVVRDTYEKTVFKSFESSLNL